MKSCALRYALIAFSLLFVFGLIASAVQTAANAAKSAAVAVGMLPRETETPTPLPRPTYTVTATPTKTPVPTATIPFADMVLTIAPQFVGTPTRVPARMPPPTQTPRPVSAAPVTLPVRLRAASGWEFIVQAIYILAAIDGESERYMADNGAYVALVGTLSNYTNKDGCIKGDDFRLLSDSGSSSIESSTIDAAKTIFHMDYPGLFRGQCLDYDKSVQSFLVFDANPYVYSWFNMQGAEVPLGPPLAVSSMLPRQTVATAATPTAVPGEAAALETYMEQTGPAIVLMSDAIGNMINSIAEPQFESDQWNDDLATYIAGIQVGYEELRDVIPPPRAAAFHSALVNAAHYCNQATYQVIGGVKYEDARHFNEARKSITQCHQGIDVARQQMPGMFNP